MRKFFHLLSIALIFELVVTAGLLNAESAREEKRLFTAGQKAMEDRLYELAELQFQGLLSQFPQSEFRDEAIFQMARARLGQGRWREAVELLEPRLQGTPEVWQDDYMLLLGDSLVKGDRFEEAFKTYESLVSRFPKSRHISDARYGMAQVLVQQRKYEAAQEILSQLMKDERKDVAARASLTLGISLGLQKKFDAASEILNRLAKEERKSLVGFKAVYALGEFELERKQTETAKKRFESLAKSDRPEAQSVVPMAFFRLGQIAEAVNNSLVAAKNYEQAFRKSDETAFRLKCVDGMTEVYLKLDKPDALADQLRAWSEENSKTRLGEALLLQVCTLWQQAGRRDQAIRAYQNFLERYPEGQFSDRAHYQLGCVFLDDKKYESAAGEFLKAAERSKNPQIQADAWLKMGDLNFERQQFDAAANAYVRSAQTKGVDPVRVEQSLYQAANSMFNAGNYPEVFRLQSVHSLQFPSGKLAPEFLALTAETQRRMGDMEKVAEAYRTFLDKYPASPLAPKIWVEYADALLGLGRNREAVDVASSFIEKNPKHELVARARLLKAGGLERLDQMDKAVAEYEGVIKSFPKTPMAADAQFSLGLYYDRQKNYAKAQEQFELMKRSSPGHAQAPAANYFAARAAYRLGQNKEDAGRLIEALVRDYPTSPWVFKGRFLYADILSERGKFEEALLIFNDLIKPPEALKSGPEPELVLEAQGRRGQCLRQLKRNEEALLAFQTILDAPRVDATLRNQACVEMGKTYENMGDLKKALESNLMPLYERNPQNPVPEEREFYWICKGGFEAVRLLEAQKDWKGAVRVLKRLAESNLPCRADAEERMRKLQTDHADANG